MEIYNQPSQHDAAKLLKLTFAIYFSEGIMIGLLYSQPGLSGKRRTVKKLSNNCVWLTSNLYFIKIMEKTTAIQTLKRALINLTKF